MANYYCLMAGLPDISLSDAKPPRSLMQLKEDLEEVLEPQDAKLLYVYFLRFDCENVVRLLQNPEAETDPRGNLSREQYEDLIRSAREINFNVHRYPAFMSVFAREYAYNSGKTGWFARDAMMWAYYDYARQIPNKMMSRWYQLNLDVQNILTALIARKQGWQLSNYIQGDGEVVEMILEHANTQDFELGHEYDYMKELMRCANTDDPVGKEKQIDAFRWNWLEEQTFFEPFDINALFSYLVRTEMLERWSMLDPEKGRERFTEIIENLRGEAKVPDEFVK
ncbi:MAG: DUF2764 domain-containing protein [Bacteroidales bacterium]|nr:DUF2764 domain-containing protein [Bacteroidales bacterium]